MATELTALPFTPANPRRIEDDFRPYGAVGAPLELTFLNTGVEFLCARVIGVVVGVPDWADITIATPVTVDGLAVAERVVSMEYPRIYLIGPFPKKVYNNTAGKVTVTIPTHYLLELALYRLG